MELIICDRGRDGLSGCVDLREVASGQSMAGGTVHYVISRLSNQLAVRRSMPMRAYMFVGVRSLASVSANDFKGSVDADAIVRVQQRAAAVRGKVVVQLTWIDAAGEEQGAVVVNGLVIGDCSTTSYQPCKIESVQMPESAHRWRPVVPSNASCLGRRTTYRR